LKFNGRQVCFERKHFLTKSSAKDFDLEHSLAAIEKVAEDLSQLPETYLGPMGTTIHDIDWFALAAIKKTVSLSHAFCTLVREKNTLSAAALVRLQVDTALRVFGLSLVEDVEDAGARLMNDERYDRLKSRDNERLTDAFLHEQLDRRYPGLTGVYRSSSAYVHLSGKHIKTGLWSREGNPTLYFNLNATDAERPDEWFADIVSKFSQATNLTAGLITSFMHSRREITTRRWMNK
jgi:hypothetical protein